MIKRSEFYAFFIVAIVLMTATVSFAVSYQPYIIQPTKPYNVHFKQENCQQNTYYTALDIRGKGICSRVTTTCSNGLYNNEMLVKITVDGVPYILGRSADNLTYCGGIAARGNDTSSTATTRCMIDFLSPIYFKSSFKVEIGQSSSTNSYSLYTTINYALE